MNRNRIAATLLIVAVALTSLFTQGLVAFAEYTPKTPYERVIAHGGGAYKGMETTNSVEALNEAIENGYKIIELDMELSSDRKIIMLHDWDRTSEYYYGSSLDQKITQNSFLSLSVYGSLEVLTIEKLAAIMEKNQDFKVVTDTKGDNIELLTKISKEYPKLVSRFIPQIYDYDQWEKVKSLGFNDIIFTLYAMPDVNLQKLASFAKEHDLYAVTMPDYFAEKGYCSQLSKSGIVIYVHPVSDFEDAQRFIRMGAYGVYSGTLLPEEFQGLEKNYYLTRPGENTGIKLTDERIKNISELKLHGLKPGDSFAFLIDESAWSPDKQNLSNLAQGKHSLTIVVYHAGTLIGSLDYCLWKDENGLRLLHKKYEYRLDSIKQEKGFDTVMKNGKVPEDVAELLKQSLIAKNGEYIYFLNGNPEKFMNGEEFLPVQTGSNWNILLPLSATLKQLGASSVSMSRSRDISVVYKNNNYMVMVNSYLIRKGFEVSKIEHPVVLYLNKAMADGEFYQYITGRSYIEKNDILVILPANITNDKLSEEQIIKSAGLLF